MLARNTNKISKEKKRKYTNKKKEDVLFSSTAGANKSTPKYHTIKAISLNVYIRKQYFQLNSKLSKVPREAVFHIMNAGS
jgi:hypothetical protein